MKYYIIAGEASGDLHGSNLMKGLYARDPEAEIRFWGGDRMNEVYLAHPKDSCGLVTHYRDGAVMGYMEVLLKASYLRRKVEACKKDIDAFKPDAVILIDYPGFNFKIARFAHEAGYKVIYYIAPKVWASRESRIKKLRAWVDRLIIVFPFEVPYFQGRGVPFTYVGNPLIDAIDGNPQLKEGPLSGFPTIALLAGSRSMEIKNMMPRYMEFADAWHSLHPETVFIVAAAPSRGEEDYIEYIGPRPYVKVVTGETYRVLKNARAAVINSGTASLEAAIIGTPQMVCYRMAPLSALIMRIIIRVKYVSLANLIIDRAAFKEFLQENFTVRNLLQEMELLYADGPYRSKMLEDYAQIRTLLGGEGASERAADAVIDFLN